MDNPVDHPLDLGLVNYIRHPDNSNYIVYRFADEDRAIAFEEELIAQKIWYEKGDEMKRTRKFILFGVHKNDFKKAQEINFAVEAKYKKPFIPFAAFRWGLILFSIGVVVLASLGYCEQQRKLEAYDTTVNSNHGQK